MVMKPKDKMKKNTRTLMHKNKKAGKKRKNLSEMSVDDMFSMIQEDDENGLMDDDSPERTGKNKMKGVNSKKVKKNQESKKDVDDEMDFDEGEDLSGVGNMTRKEYLEKLKKNDPEFYAAMMQSADVMGLQSSDEEDENDDEEDPEKGGSVFQPPAKLEIDSDESDAEEDGLEKRGSNIVTASMVTQWEKDLKGNSPLNTFLEVEQAFLAAIESLGSREKDAETTSKYKVEGPQIFNAIIRLCLRNVAPALAAILNLKSPSDDPTKSKRWRKMRNYIKSYLRHLVTLTESVAESSIAEIILSRGILPLLGYYSGHPSTCKFLLRRLIVLWSTSEKRVRVLAFICIYRLTRTLSPQFLEWVLKRLYLSYVQNSRFTSPSTWGLIDFMRISLVELYSLDQVLAYKHAFVYIRQMAFHLRNAITIKKKERVQLVYNWQYIHCLHLWADLLAKTHPSPALQPIIYPLTQVAIGTMKLQPTPSFYPLVFQVCGILTELSRKTGTFIPVLPFLLEILNKAQLEKKHKKASIKPFDWLCMLRLSRAEMSESAFKDGVVDQVYDGIINYLSAESASIGFPELVVPTTLQISVKQAGTPLATYHASWQKVREKEQLRRISNRVEMDDYNLPVVKKRELLEKQKAKDNDDFKELFASDEDDDDMDDDTRFLMKSERAKRKTKENKHSDLESESPNDSMDEEEGEELDEPALKKKKKEQNQEVDNISVASDDHSDDKVKVMNLSDFESDEEVDDFGEISEDNE
ncbi:nucleolar complex protein 2 homolog isoform X2 [Procambarus clarkii]|uniref:nucleolar complex protein 2 homolog isoform X2 n=1 Tax=Procambarus clarkii TaxID=6728 RepID=UPI0037420F11